MNINQIVWSLFLKDICRTEQINAADYKGANQYSTIRQFYWFIILQD